VHNNYYFFKYLVPALNNKLTDSLCIGCLSQNKNELILSFESRVGKLNWIIAHLDQTFTCLYFPSDFKKAKRNVANLFKPLLALRVLSIVLHENERAFSIYFEGRYQLVFKMFAQRANIILFHKGAFDSMFINRRKHDSTLDPQALDRKIDQSQQAFNDNEGNIKILHPTFSTRMITQLHQRLDNNPKQDLWAHLQQFLTLLTEKRFYICEDNGEFYFSLYPFGGIIEEFDHPITAINRFYKLYVKELAINQLKTKVRKKITKDRSRVLSWLQSSERRLNTLKQNLPYSQLGDLIMANLSKIDPHSNKVELQDFYSENPVLIPLKSSISPQKNAERYYRKGKKLAMEESILNEKILSARKKLNDLDLQMEQIEHAQSLQELKKWNISQEKTQTSLKKGYLEEIQDGFVIMIGKNARQNDKLTFSMAHKDDLFFHIKDGHGSHVILKQRPGMSFPKKVIERAAGLAAYYSKRKSESLVVVQYTPKKYVRKPKGAPAGLVIIEREKTILVAPNH